MSRHSGHHAHGARGRHKKRRSRETLAFEREHMIPQRPPWMPPEVYAKLARLRGER